MYAINDLDKINISKLLVHMDLQAQVLEDINIGISFIFKLYTYFTAEVS